MTLVPPRGLGGGGAMYSPAISPHDPFLRFVACDMNGLYRTADAGMNWEMIDGHQMFGHTSIAVVFHSTDPNTLYAYGGNRGLRSSSNRGASWADVQPKPPAALTALTIDASGRLFAGTQNGAFFLDGTTWKPCAGVSGRVVKFVYTGDPGAPMYVATTTSVFKADTTLANWTPAMGSGTNALPAEPIRDFAGGRDPSGNIIVYVVMPSIGTGTTVSGGGLWYSQTGGTSWSSAMNLSSGLNIDKGATNHECAYPQYEHLAVLSSDARIAYVTICAARTDSREYRVYKTTNGGTNWTHVLNVDGSVPGSVPATPNVTGAWQDFAPFGWGNTGRGRGLGVGRSVDPTMHAVLFTNNGIVYISDDSGATWRQRYTKQYPVGQGAPGQNQRWRSIGLEVTTTWNYYVSQDDVARHFICYTDICFSRSEDGGRAWLPLRPQNYNTIYELAIDAKATPGAGQHRQMWAAASELHDIPHWTYLLDDAFIGKSVWAGSVLTSTDSGSTWQPFGTGLPNAPVVSLVADDTTPPTLWAAVWGAGVYKYDKASGAWQLKNGTGANVLGHGANKHVFRLQWEPDAATAAGRLYCVVTGRRTKKSQTDPMAGPTYNSDSFLDDKGGVWLSTDGGDNWRCLTTNLGGAARHPRDFAVDPSNKDRIYLCVGSVPQIKDSAGTVMQVNLTGGLHVTTNANAPTPAWSEVSEFRTTLWPKNYDPDWLHGFAPFFDPHKPKKLWVTTSTHGTWVTEDATAASPTWVEYRDIPFMSTQRLRFARQTSMSSNDSSDIFLTTFGGGVFRLVRRLYFIVDRSAFSEWDVSTAQVVNGKRTFKDAIYVVLEGFLPSELGIPPGPVASVPASVAPQLALTRRSDGASPTDVKIVPSPTQPLLAEIDPIPEDVAQRFTYAYDVEFGGMTGTADFPGTGEDFIDVTATKDWLSTQASIKLFHQANPFMVDGPVPWLSQDLRVFRITRGGAAPFPGAPAFTGTTVADALAYLKQVVADFNTAPVSGTHLFDGIPESVLTLLPQNASGDPMFNCAVARTRFVPATTATTDQLRVFFRSFRTQSTSLDYQPSATYRSGQNSATPPDLIPLLGVAPAAGGSSEVVSIPLYDEPRVNVNQPLTNQTEATKFQLPAAGTSEQWRFFGALLDFNRQEARFPETVTNADIDGPWPTGAKSLQELVRGYHQCLVAEISYPLDPIDPGATPGSSENLAQRNLAISESANPGTRESRTVHHTFEITQARHYGRLTELEHDDPDFLDEELWGDPDELMIRWLDLPRGTRATIYLNRDDAAQTLRLAAGRTYSAVLRPHGVEGVACEVGEITYVPLPRGRTPIPALLTVELPEGVHYGQHYRVVVHQISGETRAVVGTFELLIPVRHAHELLWDEEDKLAIFRWVEHSLDEGASWSPVLGHYVTQIAERVRGFGGNPEAIPASPNGAGEYHYVRAGWPTRLLVLLNVLLLTWLLVLIWRLIRRAFRSSRKVFTLRHRQRWKNDHRKVAVIDAKEHGAGCNPH